MRTSRFYFFIFTALPMLLIVATLILGLLIALALLIRCKKRKRILITGTKGVGKTVLTNQLMNRTFPTVPSLCDYTVVTPEYELTDQRIKKGVKLRNGYDLIVFVFRDEIETVLPGKNVIYVSLGKEGKSLADLVTDKDKKYFVKRGNVFYLNDDLSKIKSIISARV
ncbi:hypothetical protein THOM_2735 [Trachipleistophora hominis]|uniref:Uncharacterized protein n=1 Tax=Trachipleistophora hominis TaxID=72359 RepID=L7JUE3_TRAHO|nr:hypothetical protein THOM_2735 [Trachipleistophora hominis]